MGRRSRSLSCSVASLLVLAALATRAHARSTLQAPPAPYFAPQADAPSAEVAKVRSLVWEITVGPAAPDCYEREVLLVNGLFQPSLNVVQGELLEITVVNNVPLNYPSTIEGITIHWHGFNVRGAPWQDGASYTNQCPIQSGRNYTYRFTVNEIPGSYIWHGHSGAQSADGLNGALIVRDAPGSPPPVPPPAADGEHILFLVDWYHSLQGPLHMRLNRPFGDAKDPITGNFTWIGNPDSVLLNSRGVFADCALPPSNAPANANATCKVAAAPLSGPATAPGTERSQPRATGCAHETFTVDAGKTYLFRLINSATLTYQTVCFEGHNVTIVAADAVPVEPLNVACVDINSGQRYDVLLTANQPPRNYWVTSQVQYRPGSPSGYGVLRYAGSPAGGVPSSPPPQPGSVAPWPLGLRNKVPEPTVRIHINISQPLLNETGQIRWALNNVANTETPPCTDLQSLVRTNPGYLSQHTVSAATYNAPSGFNSSLLGQQVGNGNVGVFLADPPSPEPTPLHPVAGKFVAQIKRGDVVELVVQNNAANAFNGDLTAQGANRTAQEQHPFHLHGHHFWLLGTFDGEFASAAATAPLLNTANPPRRDTATLPRNGYFVARFVADNPGTWLFHCHIPAHQLMGQLLTFVEGAEEVPPPPPDAPACPETCQFSTAPWNASYVREVYGDAGGVALAKSTTAGR